MGLVLSKRGFLKSGELFPTTLCLALTSVLVGESLFIFELLFLRFVARKEHSSNLATITEPQYSIRRSQLFLRRQQQILVGYARMNAYF